MIHIVSMGSVKGSNWIILSLRKGEPISIQVLVIVISPFIFRCRFYGFPSWVCRIIKVKWGIVKVESTFSVAGHDESEVTSGRRNKVAAQDLSGIVMDISKGLKLCCKIY